jgi:hypothetical protein
MGFTQIDARHRADETSMQRHHAQRHGRLCLFPGSVDLTRQYLQPGGCPTTANTRPKRITSWHIHVSAALPLSPR